MGVWIKCCMLHLYEQALFRLPDVDSLFKLNLFIYLLILFLYFFFFLSFFLHLFIYRKSSIKPPGEGGGGLFISSPFKGRGAYLREGAYLIERTMAVSVLHKEVEYGVEKLKYRKF